MPTKGEVYFQITGGYASLNAELSNLEPSQTIFLYEIDLKTVYPVVSSNYLSNQPIKDGILRIYNDFNLFNIVNDSNGRVLWKNEYYYPFPIAAEGFDLTTLGSRPTPKIYVANSSPDQSYNSFYKYLRMQIQAFGDLAGCKFTRIKTFLKYLHGSNFNGGVNLYTNDTSIYEVELPKDIYYIDRKSAEDSTHLEYTLVSALDIENISLPSRTIFSKRCPFMYRGEGCLYEYNKRINSLHSGIYGEITNSPIKITLPLEAPPVSTENDESFLEVIFKNNTSAKQRFSGIGYFLTGTTNNYSEWGFTNYTLGGAGTAAAAAAILTDGSASTVGITSIANTTQSIASLSLLAPAEITKIRLSSNATFRNNFAFEYSQDGSNWYAVPNISGLDSNWQLSGVAAGTYYMDFPSKGLNKYWRLKATTGALTTAITELNFSGQYRIADSGEWVLGNPYKAGDFTFFKKDRINYYYVCLQDHTSSIDLNLFNKAYWQADACSKSITACRTRWFKNPALRPVIWPIPRNGWTWDRAVYHYDSYWGEYSNGGYDGIPVTTSWTGLAGQDFIYNAQGHHPNAYGPKYRIGKFINDINRANGYQTFDDPTNHRLDQWPRRPDAIDPLANFACGIPKDASGNYLNGFLPFGGFPGTNQKA